MGPLNDPNVAAVLTLESCKSGFLRLFALLDGKRKLLQASNYLVIDFALSLTHRSMISTHHCPCWFVCVMIQRLKADWRLLIVSNLIVIGCPRAWRREPSVFLSDEQVLGGLSATRTRLQPARKLMVNHHLQPWCKNSGRAETFFEFL